MKTIRHERGQILPVVAISMTVLLGFVAFAADMGLLFRAQRNMQIAADAAAVAAALDYKYNTSVSSAQSAGETATAANGVTNGTNGAVVTINCPPASGPNTTLVGACEAIVSQPNSTVFMGLFGRPSVTVAARAVAGPGVNEGCIWALGKSGTDIPISGTGDISAPDCDVYDNSDSSNALTLSGGASLTAKEIGIVGGYTTSGSSSVTPTPTTGIAPVASPLSLPTPTIPTGTCTGSGCTVNNSGTTTLQPGTYTSISSSGGTLTLAPGDYIINGNLQINGGSLVLGDGNYTISGNFSVNGSSSVTIGSGLDIVGGSLSLTGSGSLTGTSVTFYTEGDVSLSGSSSMNLTAPTSGPYNGVLFFKSLTDSHSFSMSGPSGSTLEGIFDLPDSPVSFSGSSGSTIYADFIVDSISLSGSTSIKSYQKLNSDSLLSKTVMAE